MITYSDTLAARYNWLGRYLQTTEVNPILQYVDCKSPVTFYWSAKRGKYLNPITGDVEDERFTTADPISWLEDLKDLVKNIIDEHFLKESNIEIHTNRRLFEKLNLVMSYSSVIYGAKVIKDLECELDEIIIRTGHEARIIVTDLIDNPIKTAKQTVIEEMLPKLDKLFGITDKSAEVEDVKELLMQQAHSRMVIAKQDEKFVSEFDNELDLATKAVTVSDNDAEFVNNIVTTTVRESTYKRSLCEKIVDWMYKFLGCDESIKDEDFFIPVKPNAEGKMYKMTLNELKKCQYYANLPEKP